MPNIGPLEIGVVVLICLLVFGPKRLPELGRSPGGGMREFKRSTTGEREALGERTFGERSPRSPHHGPES